MLLLLNFHYSNNNFLSYDHPITLPINMNDCETTINFLEHVEVLTNINYTKRGVVEVYLTSPAGIYNKKSL